jgi:type IV pilus assembly protein PilY1
MLIHRNANFRTLATAMLLGVSLGFGATAAAEDTCEIPLFVKQNSGGANVMILADNSGSMNAAALHPDYNPDIDWPGRFWGGSTYWIARDGFYEPRDFSNLWESAPSVYLVNSDNGENGRYAGNYLNWLFFHATPEQRLTVPRVTRIQVLKSVLDQIIDRSSRLDMGLTVFSPANDGGNIIGKCGVNHGSLRAQIAGITANTWTPLGESMETILDYFNDRNQSPISSSCQYNFILMVTDGLPTMDEDVSFYLQDADGDGNDPGNCDSIGAPYPNTNRCSDHVDDVAWWMSNRDINEQMDGDQHAFTYVVGYNEDSPLLQETAANGQGLFFTANNAVELFLSIEYALQDILRRISAGSAVAVVSTERGYNDRLYRGKFMPVDWHGYLESYMLPYQDGDHPIWEAGNLLKTRNPNSRDIFTALGPNMVAFTPGNAQTLWEKMRVNEDDAIDLIDWGRGNEVPGLRDRQEWILGDIIHSTPVVVGPPAEFHPDESYTTFKQAHQNRRKLVYVGANDGMVHAFDADSGHEEWAFVPSFALPKFAAMADSFYCHNYTCDQTMSVKDIKLNGTWRTVMLGGGGEGGSSIFALDVTYPESPAVLWQADLPQGKKLHSEVEVVSIGGRSMALIGSGLDLDNYEANLFALDMKTGELLGTKLLSVGRRVTRNKASRPAVVDVNLDGEVDLIYVADLIGNVYRLDVQGADDPNSWSVTTIYQGDQEIQSDPVAAFGPNGAIYVYCGTGAYLEDLDMTSINQNSFLCIFDRHDGSTVTKNRMVDQTSSINDISGYQGWYIDLWNLENERVTQQAAVVAETVIFTSFAPSADPCVAGGRSYVYQMKYDDGGVPDVDYMEDEEDRSADLGDGIASYPVVDLSEGTVVVQASDASISVVPIAGIIQRLRVRSWQENYDHVEDVDADGVTQND